MFRSSTDPLAQAVHEALIAQKQTLAIAESCTGGLVTHRLTNFSGSSAYLSGAVIAYAYEAKVAMLGVTWDTLNHYGAVSAETATEMARGVRERFGTTLGIAITGIAGPTGGMPGKPVGLTYIALATAHEVIVEKHIWNGNRRMNKIHSADAALTLIRNFLKGKAEDQATRK